MKRFSFTAAAAVAALTLAGCAGETTTAPDTKATSGPNMAVTEAGSKYHLVTFSKSGGIPSDFAARVSALGGTVDGTYPEIGSASIAGLSDGAAEGLVGSGGVSDVEGLPVIMLEEPLAVEVESAESGVETPNNPTTAFFYPRQWHLRQVQADDAWAAGRLGSASVKVGILDTGLDYTLPDLVGHVNLALSKSFIPGDQALIDDNFPGAHEIADLHYHGTHVGATVSSNAFVAAGVTSKVTLVGVKVLGANGRSAGGSVLAGIMYAARPVSEGGAGVDVINMSLGGSFQKRDFPGFVATINRAINYARAQGVTIVVSAGNDAADLDHDGNGYKSYCSAPNVVCVSATGPTSRAGVNGPWFEIDAPAYYTNFGRSAISVAAPGGNTGGAVVAGCSRFSLSFRICATGNFVLSALGTSMAAPHVSGLAALLVEDHGRDPGQIRSKLQQSADDLGQRGTDPYYGKGRINVANALGL